ncbi:MAG: chemotaxis protein CheX [Candidatus Eisenbacteria bacterium]
MSGTPGPWLDIVGPTWTGTLRLDVEDTEFTPARKPELSAFVQVIGEWQGLVVVCMSQALARNATGAMFELPPEAVEPDMVRDAMGEMANVIGGAIKPGIPGTRSLSLPTVVQGEDHSVYVPDMDLLHAKAYRCGGEVFWVKLFEHVGNAQRLGGTGTDSGSSTEAAA